MDEELKGRVALVTAAAGRGCGQAIARRLAASGATVVVTDIHERRAAEVAAQMAADYPAATVVGMPLDAGDWGRIDAVVDAVNNELGPIQILVNNATINVRGAIFDYDPEDWLWCLRVNLSGAWYLCRQVMPIMRGAGGGSIVNTSSYAPDVGGDGLESPYAITKGGLNALTRCMAVEGAPHDIRVNTVSMGVVVGTKFMDDNPEILDFASPPMRTPVGVDDIAEATAFLASDRARHITGEILNVAAGAYMRN
ncbi:MULTISPECIES: SDR family oxidoreductase [unclassified Frankia]|uniref:SDR family NAD(P)-dependent oxidoreductase n=1 Tax=unclassified Frankia TaxID=2632575 RepID=UPI002AD26DA4|nr:MULTISPECIES: SDR family oxidoreductase [unclassified Frankia]